MKAFITGASGFVGGYLIDYLAERSVRVIGTKLSHETVKAETEQKSEIVNLDLRNKSEVMRTLDQYRPDSIYHLAAQSSVSLSWKQPSLTFEVNVNGTINLLEAVRKLGLESRILLIGSSEEYGRAAIYEIPINEEHAYRPGNPYSISKVAQELIGKLYVDSYGMNIIMVRAFNHTGPRQNTTFVIPDFAKRIAMIEKGYLRPVIEVGNLEAVRDFSDVRDIVIGYHGLMENGIKGEVYNIGSGKGYKIKELLDKLISLSKVKISIKTDPKRLRPSDIPVMICDTSKIKKHIAWEPSINIDQTLEDVLNYWRNIV